MKPTNVARGAVFLLAGFIGLGSSVGLLGAEEGSKAAKRDQGTAIPAKDSAVLERISARTDGRSSVVRLDGSGLGEAKAFFADPLRFVIDLPGAQGVVKAPRIEGKTPVQKIRVGRHAGETSKVRIVLDLRGPCAVEEIARTASSIELRVTRDAKSRYAKAESAPVMEARASEAVSPSAPEKMAKTEGTDAKPAEVQSAAASVQPSVGAEGERAAPGAVEKGKAESTAKASDVSSEPAKGSSAGDQTSVAKAETGKQAETSKSVEPKGKEGSGKGLGFKGEMAAGLAPQSAVEALAGQTSASAGSAPASTPESGPMFNQTIGKAGPEYTGKKISLDFQDADIKNVLRLIAEVSGFNLITSDDVTGKVTVKLLNVPWDHALDIILKTKGLGEVREGTIIRVAPMAGLTKEKEDEGKRRAAEAAAEPLVTRIVTLNFTRAKDAVPTLTKSLGPRGNITMDERTNTLVIRDIAMNVEGAAELAKTLDKPTPQVLIEARIVEVSTNYQKELGIQWGGHYLRAPAYGNALPYRFPNTLGAQGALGSTSATSVDGTKGFAVNLPASAPFGALGFSVGSIANIMSLDIILSAMETSGKLKLLSNPKVATLDNQEAVIKSGISVPYPVAGQQGTITIAWNNAMLELKVTPHITDDKHIDLKVNAKKDDLDYGNAISYTSNGVSTTVPAKTVKEAQTQLLVRDGDTIVLGGVFKSKEERSKDGLPWLADIPVLGWLFKKELDKQDNEELLIFITPRVIKPLAT